MTNTFKDLGLSDDLVLGLKKEGITEPTDIQSKVIPVAISHRDIVAQSHTGSGKTLAYLLPIIESLKLDSKDTQAIILSPTHELALQINEQIKLLAKNSNLPIRSTAVIGTASMKRQVDSLKDKPHIVVGSTGRILELIRAKKLKSHNVVTIVLDEGDRLLDDKNVEAVKGVIKTTQKNERQVMLFSATVSEKTLETAKEIMKDPEIIALSDESVVNKRIEHLYIVSEMRDKFETLRKLIAALKLSKGIVFINKSEEVDLTTAKLKYHKIKSQAIYGSSTKEERKQAMDMIRSGRIRLLVSSDLSARGLDIEDVSHIFNLDLPPTSKEYTHRVGRTARGDKSGTAISIVTEKDLPILRSYERELNIEFKEVVLSHGNLYLR